MADVGILALGTNSALSSTALVGTQPVLEVIGSPDDADYVHDNTNSTHTGTADFALGDTPSDFGNMDTLSVQLRYLQSGLSNNTWDSLRARVFQSDGTTPLTDERTVASSITTTSATNSSALAFTGVNTSANKATWDGAIVRLFWGVTRTKGGDTHSLRVTAAQITGTYTAASPDRTAALDASATSVTVTPGSVDNATEVAVPAGEVATFAHGTITATPTVVPSGIEITVSDGDVGKATDVALVGEEASATDGEVAPSQALVGIAITTATGTMTGEVDEPDDDEEPLIGESAAVSAGTAIPGISKQLRT
ncbi:MAG TPA: hypothetical protein VFB99_10745 [Vicinamibacterales bacterium]|nr:hypothetical protein [Vicinamibacterales bacterium]